MVGGGSISETRKVRSIAVFTLAVAPNAVADQPSHSNLIRTCLTRINGVTRAASQNGSS